MTAFSVPDGKKASIFWAQQQDVPGEPIFVLVQDNSSDGKESLCVATVTLDWMTGQMYDFLHDDRSSGPDYQELYVLFPKGEAFPKFPGLVRCDVGTAAGKNPGDGPRMILTNQMGVLWSCDL